jgi:hypothetical protein
MKISWFLTALPLIGLAACDSTPESKTQPKSMTAISAHSTQRVAFQIVGGDTLSDSASILRILPEQDGDGIVALFADPSRRVSAGLAIVDQRMIHPQLLWPDSVTSVWWTGPHRLAFTTRTGPEIRLVADVHAATLRIADTVDRTIGSPPPDASVDSSVAQRARAYIDSVHLQLAGASRNAPLLYSVTRIVPSIDGSMAAFQSAGRDAGGVLTNPSWFVLDRTSGAITPLDQITGPAAELPAQAGEWNGNSSFFYAKGRSIWEAEVQRVASQPAS